MRDGLWRISYDRGIITAPLQIVSRRYEAGLFILPFSIYTVGMHNDQAQEKICRANLYSVTKESYGPLYQAHFLEQYKIYIASINSVSNLKHQVNSYFLTINTILMTAVGISFTRDGLFNPLAWHTIIPGVGVILCLAWWYTTRSYKEINQMKFRALYCIEERLPLALYKTEAEMINTEHVPPGPLKSAVVEPIVPWAFIILYILIFFLIG